VNQGQQVKRGEWIGMIRFGSQVDVILPVTCTPGVTIGQQLYAGNTIIARI
jgi:phosphatidylserine decarboxylase